MKSFIVAGAVSSGNRLMAAVLVRAGLKGEGSTNQPADTNIDLSSPWVVITHHKVEEWARAFLAAGHEVQIIVMVREAYAQAKSAVLRGHFATYEEAAADAPVTVRENLQVAFNLGLPVELIPYSSMTDRMIHCFLRRHGLRHDNVFEPLQLDGQNISSAPISQNAKHYAL